MVEGWMVADAGCKEAIHEAIATALGCYQANMQLIRLVWYMYLAQGVDGMKAQSILLFIPVEKDWFRSYLNAIN